jgi:hypothetical protein
MVVTNDHDNLHLGLFEVWTYICVTPSFLKRIKP